MRPLTAVPLLLLLAVPVQAHEAAVVSVCQSMGALARGLVELRYAGAPMDLMEAELVRSEPGIRAPMAHDLLLRVYRLPEIPSRTVQARFRSDVGATVESECLVRLDAAMAERGAP